jgi:hypothetical protein
MSADTDARLTRQGLIWDNLYGPPNSRTMVAEVRRLIDDGMGFDEAIARVEPDDDDEATAAEFIVPRHA